MEEDLVEDWEEDLVVVGAASGPSPGNQEAKEGSVVVLEGLLEEVTVAKDADLTDVDNTGVNKKVSNGRESAVYNLMDK